MAAELQVGELAINWADGRAFTKSPAGEVVTVTLGGASGSGADTVLRALFVPPAPASVTATAGNTQAAISWAAPTVVAQAPITDYVVQYSSNGGTTWTTFSDGTSTATTATVTGLTNGTAYVFRVAAINAVGTGSYSTASSAVTILGLPGAPTGVAATAASGQASVSWTAPTSTGGSAITDYTVQYSGDSGTTWTTFTRAASTSLSATVTGLNNGTAYVFRVAAINSIGQGTFTAASSSVTPAIPGPSLTKLSNGTVATFTGSGTVSDPFVAASYIANYGQAARFQINGSGTVYMKYNATLNGDDTVYVDWWKDDGSARLKSSSGSYLAGTDKVLSQYMADGTKFQISNDAGTFTNVRIWVQ